MNVFQKSGTMLILVIALIITVGGVASAAMKMTPYLQAVTANSIYVLVECDSTSPVTVSYGLTTAYGSTATTESTEVTSSNPATYIHNIKLTRLQANTFYHYRVSQGGTPSADYTFVTAVNPGTSFRCAWMADCRTGTSVHDSISSAIKIANPRFSLYGGDLCYDGNYDTFKNEFFLTNELALIANVPFFNTVGNHEGWDTNTMAFTQAPSSASGNQGYYSFDYGDMHVLVLNYMDSSWGDIVGSAQYNFAKADLQNSTKPWKIVTCHSPAYCSGSHGEDATMKILTDDIFEPNHVDMVLAGHSHFYQHNLVNGIHHMVIGASGAELAEPSDASYTVKSVQDNCYGIIDITPTTFHLVVYNAEGSVLDVIDLTKKTPTPTPSPSPSPTPTLRPPTPTPAKPTPTPGATPTPSPATGSLMVQMVNYIKSTETNNIYAQIKLWNTGTSAIPLSNVKIRYYYTIDSIKPQTFWCDYSKTGSSNVTGTFVNMANPKTNADYYLEIGFANSAGNLAAGTNTEVQIRFAKTDWSNFIQPNDYSFNSTATVYVDWPKITGYISGNLVWGVEP